MPSFYITEKRPSINIFKLNKAYYFKHFFDDPELFREDRKGFDPNLIENPATLYSRNRQVSEFRRASQELSRELSAAR